jgi:hypothetical protein
VIVIHEVYGFTPTLAGSVAGFATAGFGWPGGARGQHGLGLAKKSKIAAREVVDIGPQLGHFSSSHRAMTPTICTVIRFRQLDPVCALVGERFAIVRLSAG